MIHCGNKKKGRHSLIQKTVVYLWTHHRPRSCILLENSQHWPKVQISVAMGILSYLAWGGLIKLNNNRLLIVLTSSRFLVLVAMTFIVETPRWQSAVDTDRVCMGMTKAHAWEKPSSRSFPVLEEEEEKVSECSHDSRTLQTKSSHRFLTFVSPSNLRTLPTMATCLSQPYHFHQEIIWYPGFRQPIIQILLEWTTSLDTSGLYYEHSLSILSAITFSKWLRRPCANIMSITKCY